MKRAAVFGNAGGGKSTFARHLAEITRLPLYVLDKLQFREGGAAVPHDEYLEVYRDLLARETWIIAMATTPQYGNDWAQPTH
jgi:adenylate kinase family enzyme